MLLNLAVYDAAQTLRGSVDLWLDWSAKKWFLEKDEPRGTWEKVGFTCVGPFEPQPSEIICLWDETRGHNSVVFSDAPEGEKRFRNNSGEARIHDPQDREFKEGKLTWSINPFGLIALAGPPIGSGLRNPDPRERLAITSAEDRMRFLLVLATPKLDAIIAGYRARDTAALRSVRSRPDEVEHFRRALGSGHSSRARVHSASRYRTETF